VSTPPPVRVRLRYADLDSFVERFAPNVTRGGVFLPSRSPRPVGEVFEFEVQLAGGQVALAGAGKVMWVKELNPAEPNKPHGMGVQFVRLDPASRETLNRMLKLRGMGGPAAAGGPRSPSQPLAPLSRPHAGGGSNGTAAAAPAPRVDTSVDLAAEFGLEESAIRRAAVDSRLLAGRGADQELEDLLKPEPAEPASLAQALAELPRLLDPTARRRTGTFRALEITNVGLERTGSGSTEAKGPVIPPPPAPPRGNGTGEGEHS
jgi:uncharacterized protein (TIGR02266 family)